MMSRIDTCSSHDPGLLVVTVILNWNSWQRTLKCVQDLAAVDYSNCRVIVVDNDSRDGSEEEIRRAFPDIEVIQTGANLGYAGGNNVGIDAALAYGADYLLILNPDVTLERRAIAAMIDHCAADTQLAAVCPVTRWNDNRDRVWFGGARISWRTGFATHRYAPPVTPGVSPSDWATGSCMLLSARALRHVGMFDPDFFLYWEEVDLCQRLIEAGFSVGVASDAVAYHDVSHSIGVDSPSGWYYFVRNAFYFFSQHAPKHGTPRLLAITLLCLRLVFAGTVKALLLRDGTARARLLGAVDFFRSRRGPSARFTSI